MYPSRSKARLGNFEAMIFAKNNRGGWDGDVAKGNLSMAVGRVIITKDCEGSYYVYLMNWYNYNYCGLFVFFPWVQNRYITKKLVSDK